MLKLKGITRSFRVGPITMDVLRGVDLDVEQGDLVSIMGESGSGKSTLMNIIGLLDSPTAGSYHIDGRDMAVTDGNARASLRNELIGFVFQSFHLLPRMSALNNVALPLVYRGEKAAARREVAAKWLDRVGMEKRLHHRPNELSGGQRQRVAIARALAGHPRLLLADEPTGALDAKTSREIMDLFLELNEEEDVTTMIITHDSNVGALCRRRLHLSDGLLGDASGADD